MTARGKSLRDNLIARLAKKIGASIADLTDQQVQFISVNVDALVLSGTVGNADLNAVVHKFRTVFTEFGAPKPLPAGPSNSAPVAPPPLAASTKAPPTSFVPAPPPGSDSPSKARASNRQSAVARENRIQRDQEWAGIIAQDASNFEAAKRREKEIDHAKKEEQRRILERQVLEQTAKKIAQEKELRAHTQSVIETAQRELEQERHEREAAKRKMHKERATREKMLNEHVDHRKKELEARVEEERRYLQEIQEEERNKKEAEIERRKKSRSEFQSYIAENRAQEDTKRERREHIRAIERQEVEEMRRLQNLREEESRQALISKANRSDKHSRKQDAILQRYEGQRALADQEEKAEAERFAKVLEEKQRRDAEEEALRKQRKSALKRELVAALDNQMAERQTMQVEQRNKEIEFRNTIDTSLGFGARSQYSEKEREAERKLELQRILDAQIREKQLRERMGVQTKIK